MFLQGAWFIAAARLLYDGGEQEGLIVWGREGEGRPLPTPLNTTWLPFLGR